MRGHSFVFCITECCERNVCPRIIVRVALYCTCGMHTTQCTLQNMRLSSLRHRRTAIVLFIELTPCAIINRPSTARLKVFTCNLDKLPGPPKIPLLNGMFRWFIARACNNALPVYYFDCVEEYECECCCLQDGCIKRTHCSKTNINCSRSFFVNTFVDVNICVHTGRGARLSENVQKQDS